MSKCGRYWEKHLGRGNSGEMLGSGHVAGMFEEQRGGLCGWHGENRREEEVRDVEGGGWPEGVRCWFSSLAVCEIFLGSFKKY